MLFNASYPGRNYLEFMLEKPKLDFVTEYGFNGEEITQIVQRNQNFRMHIDMASSLYTAQKRYETHSKVLFLYSISNYNGSVR
jgi:hypothetical protein